MGKKVREYKSGDFIFAKVKGYPAWPARVQKLNGKRYFVYFYGTGETANLPPNMIFDYAENKDKFLTKTVKRRDFNDGVKQIEYDFANNVPLEEVIGVPMEAADVSTNETANDSALDASMDESAADTTANDTVNDDANATQTEAAVEDSDEAGTLVIDEGKTPAKGKKAKPEAKGKETPKVGKTPRGKGKKDEPKEKEKEEEKADEELVSRSGRKIRPKRYIDEQTEENATLPSPAPKRRRASPVAEKEKAEAPPKEIEKEGKSEKTFTEYNVVKQSELEGLKKPFEPSVEEDKDKENILIAYLPNSTYVGIKVFQSRPRAFKNEAARLHWDKQAARNALTLKMQLEREHITPQSVAGQLVMELNLTDEEKATLDKERETEEKKSRVNFLKTEMKLIELDAKIKTCLCLEKADTELCLKLLDELLSLEVKPLMLLKHPTCLETVKRMRAYVGNTPSWDLSEQDALAFSKQAHTIRKKADLTYNNMKEHFQTPEGLSFWEYFSERVLTFKKVTANLNAGELLELVHEPIELSQPHAGTMRAAIEQANSAVPPLPDAPASDEERQLKKKSPAKSKKPAAASTPSKSKRARNKKEEDAEEDAQKPEESAEEAHREENEKEGEKSLEDGEEEASKDTPKEPDSTPMEQNEDIEMAEVEKNQENELTNDTAEKDTQETHVESEANDKTKQKSDKTAEKSEKSSKKDKKSKNERSESEKSAKDNESGKEVEKKDKKSSSKEEKNLNNNAKGDKNGKESEKSGKDSDKSGKDSDKSGKDSDKSGKDSEKIGKDNEKSGKDSEKSLKDSEKIGKDSDKGGKEKEDKSEEKADTDKSDDRDEPRAKRSRESKKTEPPSRSPAKRKSKP